MVAERGRPIYRTHGSQSLMSRILSACFVCRQSREVLLYLCFTYHEHPLSGSSRLCFPITSDRQISQTQLPHVLFICEVYLLSDYMFRPFFIKPSSGRTFFIEETVKFR
jgi:hypothetical protein